MCIVLYPLLKKIVSIYMIGSLENSLLFISRSFVNLFIGIVVISSTFLPMSSSSNGTSSHCKSNVESEVVDSKSNRCILCVSLITSWTSFTNYHAYLIAYWNPCVLFSFVEGKIEISKRLYGFNKEAWRAIGEESAKEWQWKSSSWTQRGWLCLDI